MTEDSYIVIQSWMMRDLKLSGNRLIVYALIHGFSQDGKSTFHGGLNYLVTVTGLDKSTIIRVLKSLTDDNLLERSSTKKNGVEYSTYKTTRQGGGKMPLVAECNRLQNATEVVAECNRGGGKMPPNNKKIIKDNKDISSSLRSEDIPPDSSPRSESPPNDVLRVFRHWQTVMNSPRSRLDDKRRRIIRNALKHYSVSELMFAIEGCRMDDWSMGNNDRGTKFNGIDIILRDAEHIDKFINIFERPARPKQAGTFAEYFNKGRVEHECPVLLG